MSLQAGQIVFGLIEPGGPVASRFDGENWTLSFRLAAWRLPGSKVEPRPLRCVKQVADKSDLSRWYPICPGSGLIQFEVERQTDHTVWVGDVTVLKNDTELEAARQFLQKPVILNIPELGSMELDRSLDVFLGNIVWNGRPARLTLSCENTNQPEVAINAAKVLMLDQEKWGRIARNTILAELLPIKNETWLQEDEKPLTSDEFMQTITLIEVDICDDGAWSLSYNDGDIFWGHTLVVSGRVDFQELRANIEG